MKKILVFGAGRSATILLDYLLQHARVEKWQVTVVDADIELARKKLNNSPDGIAVSFNIMDAEQREQYIRESSIVISMLPPHLHSMVAQDCVKFSRNLLTASYLDDDMRKLQSAIDEKKLLFLCEMGLDPGIDHMSAMKIILDIRKRGGIITSFRSHCGGLVAPESDDNPWHYKISWNSRNIILAGKAGAHYRDKGEEVRLTHAELFDGHRTVDIPGMEPYGWYANRDSLSYTKLYELEDAGTFVRTTLRHPLFMAGWKHVIDLQLTDETPAYETDRRSLGEVFKEHLEKHGLLQSYNDSMKQARSEEELRVREQLRFLGFEDDSLFVNKGRCSAADLLLFAVENKLALQDRDKDMVIMLHEFEYELASKKQSIKSTLVVKGEDRLRTAMAKTVGLPLGIAARLILNGTIDVRGLYIPTIPEIFEPVLAELERNEIRFKETRD